MQDDHEETLVCSILVIKGLKIHDHAQSGCGAYNVHRAAISDSLSQKQHEAEELGLKWVVKLLADHRNHEQDVETPPYYWVEMFSVLL